jgi:DNA polymerase phi
VWRTSYPPHYQLHRSAHRPLLPALATQALLLALRCWNRLPADVIAACPLLPSGPISPAAPLSGRPPGEALFGEARGGAAAAFFTRHHLHRVLPVLRATSSSHPRLHSAWGVLLELIAPGLHPAANGDAPGQAGREQLEALWETVVEGDVMRSPSHERNALGFALFDALLPHLQ